RQLDRCDRAEGGAHPRIGAVRVVGERLTVHRYGRAGPGGAPGLGGGCVRGAAGWRNGSGGWAGGHTISSELQGWGDCRYWERAISAWVEEIRSRASQVIRGVSGSRSRASRTSGSAKRGAPSKWLTATAYGSPCSSRTAITGKDCSSRRVSASTSAP